MKRRRRNRTLPFTVQVRLRTGIGQFPFDDGEYLFSYGVLGSRHSDMASHGKARARLGILAWIFFLFISLYFVTSTRFLFAKDFYYLYSG